MARQTGNIFIEGTIDDLSFYRMDGKYYVRLKSSLIGKKFWKSKAFARSRESCKRFAEGNQIASRVYKMIDKEKRVYKLFCFLKGKAVLLLKEGKNLKEAEEVLMDYLMEFGFAEKNVAKKSKGKSGHKDHLVLKDNSSSKISPAYGALPNSNQLRRQQMKYMKQETRRAITVYQNRIVNGSFNDTFPGSGKFQSHAAIVLQAFALALHSFL